jgi:hypothetical protein
MKRYNGPVGNKAVQEVIGALSITDPKLIREFNQLEYRQSHPALIEMEECLPPGTNDEPGLLGQALGPPVGLLVLGLGWPFSGFGKAD